MAVTYPQNLPPESPDRLYLEVEKGLAFLSRLENPDGYLDRHAISQWAGLLSASRTEAERKKENDTLERIRGDFELLKALWPILVRQEGTKGN